MNDPTPPHDVPKTVTERIFAALQVWLGPRVVATAVGLFILLSASLDTLGKTTNAWSYIKQAFSEKTSVLNTAEIEVLDEWIVLIDSADSFQQADAYRQQLVAATSKFANQDAAQHFARNLRVVRDPNSIGTWLLTADINNGRSTKAEVSITITCLKKHVSSWESDDILSPWFTNAQAVDYSLAAFSETYGRPKNRPETHQEPIRPDSDFQSPKCPSPYA